MGIKSIYSKVAKSSGSEFHFKIGRELVERLNYSSEDLDLVQDGSIDSFAGVVYYFGLANLKPGSLI